MFEEGNPALIFKFLDEETSIREDIQIILKCPKRLSLLKAIFHSARYL
jgi:lycopene beta-cyclase